MSFPLQTGRVNDAYTHRPRRAQLQVLHCLWNGEVGGAERAVYQLVREQIRDPRLQPAILFAQAHGHYWRAAKSLGCPVIELALSHGHALPQVRRVASRIRDFDIHHFHSAEPAVMLSSILCRAATRVYTHRGGLIQYSPSKRLRYELTGLFLRRYFHALSGNTLHGARAGAQLYHLDPESFDVTYNGLAVELLVPERQPDAIRAELGVTHLDFVLGTVSNLKSWKRIDRLVDLVPRLRDQALRLVVVGDGPERGALEAQARRLGITSRVIFVGTKPHPPDYLQIMDAFCLPSMGLESFGNAAVEAMAMGVPAIVLADGGGTTEHIEDGRTGFIVRDQEGLVEAVRRLIAEPSLRRRIGQNAAVEVRRRYTPRRAARSYLKLYEKAIAAKSRHEKAGEEEREARTA